MTKDKSSIIYTDATKNISKSILDDEIMADFLPPPEKLVRKELYNALQVGLDQINNGEYITEEEYFKHLYELKKKLTLRM